MKPWLLWAVVDPTWHVSPCPELDASRLAELTALETGTVEAGTRFDVRCESEAFVLGVRRPERAPIERPIPRRDVAPEAPERYLALEIAELYAGSGYQGPWAPPSAAPAAQSPAPSQPAPGWGVVAASGQFEAGGDPVVPAGGGGVALYARVWKYLSVATGASGLAGTRRIAGGTVRSTAVWGHGLVLATVDAAPVTLLAGAGACVGATWFRGVPTSSDLSGRTHGGLSWSPMVSVGLLAPRRSRWSAVAAIDAGWVLRPVRGLSGDDVVVSSAGPWVGVRLGVGVRFGS